MKDSRNERLRAMFAGRGYYIAIALCLVAAGTIGYFALRERPVTVEQTDTPPVLDIQPVTPTQPVVKPAPVVIPDPVEEVEITEPAELLPQVVSPLDGTTVTVFSMTELLYDPTMADWRTHDGIDVQADEGAAVKTAAAGTVQSVTDDELMGTTVVIQHEGGYATQYSSLQENTPVAQGQAVTAGEVIGYVGSTSAAESRMGRKERPVGRSFRLFHRGDGAHEQGHAGVGVHDHVEEGAIQRDGLDVGGLRAAAVHLH